MAVKTGFKTDPSEALESGADAVVYRQGKVAVGLKYVEKENSAPIVVAVEEYSGADAYVGAAREKGIYIKEWGVFADVLAEYELGEEICPDLYEAAANVLARAYSRFGRKKKKKKRKNKRHTK